MLASYLKVFARLILRQAAFTLVNIVGLAVAMACCLVIALYIRHELSYEQQFTQADNLYRVNNVSTASSGEVRTLANTWFPVAPLLQDNFPEIAEVARWDPHVSSLIVGEQAFVEDELKMVDPSFFSLFDTTWIEGSAESAFSAATDLVVTRSFAERVFGGTEVFGQSVQMAQGPVLRITGVIEDLPANTHLSGTAFASMALREVLGDTAQGQEWAQTGYYTYVLLQPGTNVSELRQALDAFALATIPQPEGGRTTLQLQAISDIHMHYTLGDWPGKPPGNWLSILVFAAIGSGILLVACVNFVNLSTARSSQRVHEVGMRLTLGAARRQLLAQFLGESVLFVLLAIVVALTLVELSLPVVQNWLGLDLAFASLVEPVTLASLLGAGVVLGLSAGWYPAFIMSRYRPLSVMKDPRQTGVRGMALKNVLVVLQFALAIGMVVAAAVIMLQMRYAASLDLGYVRSPIVHIVTDDRAGSYDRRELLKERMLQGAGIVSASLSSASPAQNRAPLTARAEGSDGQRTLAYFPVDADFFALYEIAHVTGRLPDPARPGDRLRSTAGDAGNVRGSVVLNESGARVFGWSAEEAVGKRIEENGAWMEVIGVVEDTITSVLTPARPGVYAVPEDTADLYALSVKLDARDVAGGMAFVEQTWKTVNPGEPMTSIFVSDLIEMGYADAARLEKLVFVFAGMAVLICCMGLFGLANFSAQQRIKEIGVRKVMGGTVWQIILLLTNDFSKLVLIANGLAWPAAWWAMSRWLEQFAYRIDLTPMVFIGSGLIALCVAWVTVGGTAAKAATQKPVLALRHE